MRRDAPSCDGCGSSTRLRAMMNALSVELFGLPLLLADFPVLKSIRGLGLSDNRECATVWADKFDYRNTFYHQEPRLDVTRAGSDEDHGAYDFILAGEIFEHVPPSVDDTLTNVRSLLKPDGFLVLTVPYSTEATTREHFPMMKDYRVVSVGEHVALLNRTAAGEWQVFDDVVFHGGDGSTLEVRLFSEAGLTDALSTAGFGRVQYMTDEHPPFGILHEGSWGVPIVASAQPYRLRRESIAELMARQVDRSKRDAEELGRQTNERLRLEKLCRELNAELDRIGVAFEERGRWALTVNEEIERNREEIAQLQAHEQELRNWALAEAEETKRLQFEVTRLQFEIKRLQLEREERTQWALRLKEEVKQGCQDVERLTRENDVLRRSLHLLEASRWSHLGRVLGLGPKMP
jgi:hypothetical protein